MKRDITKLAKLLKAIDAILPADKPPTASLDGQYINESADTQTFTVYELFLFTIRDKTANELKNALGI